MLTDETEWVGYDVSLSRKNLGPLNQTSFFNNSFTISPRLASSAGLMLVGSKFYWEGSEPSCVTAERLAINMQNRLSLCSWYIAGQLRSLTKTLSC